MSKRANKISDDFTHIRDYCNLKDPSLTQVVFNLNQPKDGDGGCNSH